MPGVPASAPRRGTRPAVCGRPDLSLARATRTLHGLLALAILVSIVHYTDNFLNIGQYPRSATLPNPPSWVIPAAWLLFTSAGLAGARLFAEGRISAACILLAVYSGSGLIGFAHYIYGDTSRLAWWRHVHICSDIACGIAIFAFAMWANAAFGDEPVHA